MTRPSLAASARQWLVEQLNGTGKIICLNGISGLSTSEQRWAGAKSVFDQNPGIEVLAVEDANWDYATGKTVTSDLLAAYPQIDGVWSQGGLDDPWRDRSVPGGQP